MMFFATDKWIRSEIDKHDRVVAILLEEQTRLRIENQKLREQAEKLLTLTEQLAPKEDMQDGTEDPMFPLS